MIIIVINNIYIYIYYVQGRVERITRRLSPKKNMKKATSDFFFFFNGLKVGFMLQTSYIEGCSSCKI